MTSTLARVLLVCSLSAVDAGLSSGVAHKENDAVHPAVSGSDKKFFGKNGDYPWDARPKVDVLHFKHPYPVVQDSDEFDKDFVKDENHDDGSYKAQTEYDRLRHKLAKEKAEVAKAMEAKKNAENELQDAMRRKKEGEEKARREKEMQEEKAKKEKKKKEGSVSGSKGESEEKEKNTKKKVEVPEKKMPGGAVSPGGVKVATGDTEKAMDALEECKKQLAEAREKLKKLMKDLEDAKKVQTETQAALDAAEKHLKVVEEGQVGVDKAAQHEKEEYLAAKEAYEKQQNLVAKMEQDIKAAAAKVKAFRDAEDKDGGVYPSKEKSAAAQSAIAPLLVLVAGSLLLQ